MATCFRFGCSKFATLENPKDSLAFCSSEHAQENYGNDKKIYISGQMMNLPDDDRRAEFVKVWQTLIATIDDTSVTPQSAHFWHFINKALRSQTNIVNGPSVRVQRPNVAASAAVAQPRDLGVGLTTNVSDMLDEAEYFIEIFKYRYPGKIGRVAVLNMASANHAGGGVRQGALNAQEEDLSRRTNLMLSISPDYNTVLWPAGSKYKIPSDGLVYSPGVSVLRDNRTKDYEWIPASRIFKVDVVSSAAINLSRVDKEKRDKERWINAMWLKAIALFQSVINGNVNRLVLAPWGAGAFGAEPEWPGQLFAEAMIALFVDNGYPTKFLDMVSVVSVPQSNDSLERMTKSMVETFNKFNIKNPFV